MIFTFICVECTIFRCFADMLKSDVILLFFLMRFKLTGGIANVNERFFINHIDSRET